MPRKVILIDGDAIEESGIAAEQLTPGMLVEPAASGNEYQAHSTPGGPAAAMFVRSQHERLGNSIFATIPAGDEATILYPEKGRAKINALTQDTITRGDFVESAGNGEVRLFGSGIIIGQAVEDSDLSGTHGHVVIVLI